MKKLAFLLALVCAAVALPSGAQQAFKTYPEQQKGFNSFIRGAPAYVDVVVLVAAANATYTVPASADAVVFSANCAAFYAIVGPTAAVPGANVTNGTGSELNPSSWYIGKATQIGLISPTACTVTLSWYKLVLA